MRRLVLVSALWIAGAGIPAQSDSLVGGVCIAPISSHAERVDHDMPGGVPQKRRHTYEFTVQIDKSQPLAIPGAGSKPILLGGLSRTDRHLVTIRDAGKLIESFWFKFDERGADRLCLSYTPWYQTWQLDPPRRGASWCRCESEE